ncbi:MAG TPA: hypothetical protein PK771_05705 [Spirochaetota bacterium]|nr:hypothetical protein [Spirochaetota bacterium]
MKNKKKSLTLQLFKLFFLEIWRNKQGLSFLFLLPIIFLSIAIYTANEFNIPIKLYNFTETIKIVLNHKQILVLYITAAVIGFLSSYYCMVMFQESLSYFKYCAFIGLPLLNYMIIRILFFIGIVVLITLLVCSIIIFFVPINNIILVYLGFIFMGFIYGLYGGIVGVITNNFLSSFLMIIMLTNLDVGWLQNPVFYSFADNTLFIRFLPAFFPCQFIFTSAYTDKINYFCGGVSILYISVLFLILTVIFNVRIKGLRKSEINLKKIINKKELEI